MSYKMKKDAIIQKIEQLIEKDSQTPLKDACVSPLLKDFSTNNSE